jgi:hypothetical protein
LREHLYFFTYRELTLRSKAGSPAKGKSHGIPEMAQDIFIGHINWKILKSGI